MLSYVHRPGPEPLLGLTVGTALDRAAERWPGGEALVVPHQDVRWNWSELRKRSRQLGAALLASGLEPGDRVGILAPNIAEWIVVQFGTAYAGLILVNINPAYRLHELEYALVKTGCAALVTVTSFKTTDYIEMLSELAPALGTSAPGKLAADRIPNLRLVVSIGDDDSPGVLPFAELLSRSDSDAMGRLEKTSSSIDFDEPINIQFTSGTTGQPKAATLTHHNIVNNARIAGHTMKLVAGDRLCVPVPMYHCFGMVLGSLAGVTCGSTIVFPSAGFDAAAVLSAVSEERCTALHGVPTMFIAELDALELTDHDLSSLRTGIMAGAPCPVELMHRVMDEMHLSEITIGYGMTETGPLSTQTAVDDPMELRVGTVGRVLPHTEVKIVDADGRIVLRGEPGELATRGYSVMRGYWADPEKTREAIDEAGWIRSGDLASIDDRGYVRIVGRIKDMIIRGGENIYPREIEEFLYTHPAIDEAEVFGVPDAKYGEQVAVWVRLHEGQRLSEADLRRYCEGRLAHFKIPRYIKFVDRFPMTVTGKVQKFVMRDEMAAELGLPVPS